MTYTKKQKQQFRSLPGFHLNAGTPCEHPPHEIRTRKKVGYSDFVTYYHSCGVCGNEFSTYIEG